MIYIHWFGKDPMWEIGGDSEKTVYWNPEGGVEIDVEDYYGQGTISTELSFEELERMYQLAKGIRGRHMAGT